MTALRRGQVLTRPLQRKVFAFAKSLMDSDEAGLARVLLRLLRKMEPYEAKVQWLLGLCEFHLGHWANARQNLECHWQQTRRPQTAFMLARLSLVLGDRTRMAELLRAVPPYERYLLGNSALLNLMYTAIPAAANSGSEPTTPHSDLMAKALEDCGRGGLAEFGPFFNSSEEQAASDLVGRLYWKRGMANLDAAQVNAAVSDFQTSERYLTNGHRGNHV